MTRSRFAVCTLIFGLAALPIVLSKTSADAAADEFKDWVEYQSPDGAFRLSFPSVPVVEVSSTKTPGTTVSMTTIMSSNGAFALVVHEPEHSGSVATNALDRMTRPRAGSTLEYVRDISLGSIPGRETFRFQSGAWFRERFYWVGGRLYNLMAVTRTKNEGEEYDRYFFDSFRLN